MRKDLAALFASAALIAGCGGGGSSDLSVTPVPPSPSPATPPTTPPNAVNDTVANFIGYLLVLVGQTDGGEALDVSAVTPLLSETTEPTELP
jgi:hypothetical protein